MFVKNDIKELNTNKIQDDEMALSEHIEEFSQRIIFCLILLVLSTVLCFTDIKQIVQVFQIPAVGIKFLQFAPGEYFFASVKIAAFCGILLSSPITVTLAIMGFPTVMFQRTPS
jgi:sec-independent protein translocase protein TatC